MNFTSLLLRVVDMDSSAAANLAVDKLAVDTLSPWILTLVFGYGHFGRGHFGLDQVDRGRFVLDGFFLIK